MKKSIICFVLAMIMVAGLVGCTTPTQAPAEQPAPAPEQPAPAPEQPAPEPEKPAGNPWEGKRLGVAHITLYDEWCKGVYDEFLAQAKALGFGEVNIQDGNLNAETQQKQVEDFITQKYDLIMIDPVSPEGIIPTLEKAQAAGIPTIAFDSGTPFSDLIAHIAWDHAETGVLTGKYVADYAEKNLDGKVKVGVLAMLNAPHTAIRSETFKQTLEERLGKENVEYVYDQDFGETRESATNIVQNNIAKPVDIIWCAVDNAAFGAKVALETNGVQGTKIVCAGAWGTEPFTTLNGKDPYYMVCIGVSPGEIVKLSLQAAMDYFSGKTDIQKSQNIELSVIDQNNIGDFMKYVQ